VGLSQLLRLERITPDLQIERSLFLEESVTRQCGTTLDKKPLQTIIFVVCHQQITPLDSVKMPIA
jgi:hypothetical protein